MPQPKLQDVSVTFGGFSEMRIGLSGNLLIVRRRHNARDGKVRYSKLTVNWKFTCG